ncbi:DUF883 family protein [Celeribacter indicus]|uniref:DUF883 domain-containing protein n=1 Tax=Celeribacter indicus TaxID=1208324 RepID=A0A0B5DZS1_9RHOB|nr:DUF883 family protein [Celeribacter indicus]AJE46206.1 hypothetical protein P73_1491 [Celeribacter indicus]SDW49963.1 Membrane-anchored ribosome-binding protein, inhibits growth in stationary phase, ElaB/YqjD/DUF883 family [Celeribacter indicus]
MARVGNSPTEVTTEELQAQIATLKDDIAALTKTMADYGSAQGKAAKASAQAALTEARARGAEHVAHAQQSALDAYGEMENRVRENPSAAMGLAAGLGFLVGLLAARR